MMEQIYFVLTERCNLTCSHCIRDSSPQRSETSDVACIKKTIDDISKFYPDCLVLLSGGEPTLFHGFIEVLQYALSRNLRVNINSNGMTKFFKESGISFLAANPLASVQISLDGVEIIHDKIRGKGSYKRALQTIERLRVNGVSCSVSTTVMEKSFLAYTAEFLQSLDNLGLAHIAVKRATYAGRASHGTPLSTTDWNWMVQYLRNLQLKTRLIAYPMYDFEWLDNLDESVLSEISLPASTRNCGAGTSKVYIYTDGSVCPCTCFKDFPMGNLSEATLREILTRIPVFNVTNEVCNTCKYFKLCNGGCLGSGYSATKTLNTPDPRCPRHEKLTSTSDMRLIQLSSIN